MAAIRTISETEFGLNMPLVRRELAKT